MCFALLTRCTLCSWTLGITYPLCAHAKVHQLSQQECPARMQRKYEKVGVCRRCTGRKGSLGLGPGAYGEESDSEEDETTEKDVEAVERGVEDVGDKGEESSQEEERMLALENLDSGYDTAPGVEDDSACDQQRKSGKRRRKSSIVEGGRHNARKLDCRRRVELGLMS
ncbi:hypothetical protein K504DRAFT_453564 [Pleomassaria siparia CBS 279.74]|uniref:C2H2-type domain-containing protein n=1 Tax=Pleomassaria siparia CBS 279.74 TaxID=1314801 RepID=A0A6G1KH86_9PLEO|nr:hypothetical protein K504DRAFT_453564 [Pleomassaria siparia CBS 279.74]